MATWNSRFPVKYASDAGDAWVDTELEWEYNTTSDILKVITKRGEYEGFYQTTPPKTLEELHSKEDALALLELLADWAEMYEGDGTVQRILEKRMKDGQ